MQRFVCVGSLVSVLLPCPAPALGPALAVGGPPPIVIYVDDDAPPGGNGQTWARAFRHLQNALAVGAGNFEIRVAQGVQRPDQSEGGLVVPGDRAATFALKAGVTLRGGYAGLGAADPNANDPVAFVSLLSGDLLGNDGPDFVNNTENSRHIVTTLNAGGSSVLSGFRIAGGRAEASSKPDGTGAGIFCSTGSGTTLVSNCTLAGNFAGYRGGGLYMDAAAHVTVQDCSITGNRSHPGSGAGMAVEPPDTIGSCTISGTSFTDNHATEAGGGCFASEQAPLLFDCEFTANRADAIFSTVTAGGGAYASLGLGLFAYDCTWTDNSSKYGGAVYVREGFVHIEGGSFESNSTDAGSGGAVLGFQLDQSVVEGTHFADNTATGGDGGGLALQQVEFWCRIRDCSFTGNHATGSGGGASLWADVELAVDRCQFDGNTSEVEGGGLDSFCVSSTKIRDCVFEANSSDWGGGLNDGGHNALVERCRFANNSSQFRGGGALLIGTNPRLVNCVLRENQSENGGGLAFTSTNGQIVHCTIANNTATVAAGGARIAEGALCSLVNSVVWGNSAPLGAQLSLQKSGGPSSPNALNVARSCVQGGQAGVYKPNATSTLTWAPDNISTDPRFVDTADLHLLFSSPCRDTADGTVALAPDDDWEFDVRPTGAGPDLGADEFADKLYVTGDFHPGGAVKVKVLGTPGAVVKGLALGLGLLDPPLHGAFGDWHLASPTIAIVLMTPLSADGLLALPATLGPSPLGPYEVYLQALVGNQLSNVATLAVE